MAPLLPLRPRPGFILSFALPSLIAASLFGPDSGAEQPPAPRDRDWPVVHGEPGGSRFSPLIQIDRRSVRRLEVAWTFHTGDAEPGRNTNIECTPIVAGDTLYLTSVRTRVHALDAATGKEKWRFDPFSRPDSRRILASGGVNRGVAFWRSADGAEERVILGTSDGRLISLDARTGRPDPRFGRGGEVDMRAGYDRDLSRLPYGMTSPPAIYQDTIVTGCSTGEGPRPGAPGDVRAFDARTGRERWRFHTVPQPGEFGHDTWEGDSWKERGGCNNWSGATIDTARGLVFCGTGSPAFDFYGGDRKGRNLFGNCVLCLDARTGRRLWHFQAVRHDLWDYDLPCPPVLCTVRRNGAARDAVAQVTKTGFCFILDRLTGEPLFPVEERAAPASDIPGEAAWPTQIFPLKPPPLVPQEFGPEMVTDISPEARRHVLERIRTMRYGPIFTPTGLTQTVRLPGFHGGASWAGASLDPRSATLYVNVNNIPREHALEPAPPGSGAPYRNTGYRRFVDGEGFPAIKPPWGLLIAIDLNRGAFRWRVPLGEYSELTRRGVPITGTESLGGTIVTAGGLVFVAGTKDERIRACDAGTGRTLWQAQLPAAGYATPCTYSVGGRQFVVIAAGGGGKLETRSGDAFVAFALPPDVKRRGP